MKQQPSTPFDKLPPYDLAAEESVVGSCLVSDDALALCATAVKHGDFFQEKNGLIFEAMLALQSRGEPTSPIPVAHELGRRGLLDAAGGLAYLTQLTTELPTSVGAEFYARIVARDATYRRMISAAGRIAQMAYEGGADIESTLVRAYDAIRQAEGPRVERDWVGVDVLTDRLLPGFLDRLHSGQTRGIATGLVAVDRILTGRGLLPGKLYVAGGYTSMGKSTFLRIVLRNIALSGRHVALVTPEQDETEVWEELLYGLAGFDHTFHEATGAEVTESEERAIMDAASVLGTLGTFHISPVVAPKPGEIRLRLMRLAAEHPDLAVVGIDYLHILTPDNGRRNGTEENDLSDMTKAIRDTAKELNLACILMAQLNRASQQDARKANEYRPIMTDFHGASTIEKVAYAVLGLHRRGYYVPDRLEPKPAEDDVLEAIVLKQQRGPRGIARLRFEGALSQISDVED